MGSGTPSSFLPLDRKAVRPVPSAATKLEILLSLGKSFTANNKMQKASPVAPVAEQPRDSAVDARDTGSIPASGRAPGGGHGSPLQCSCLENSMNKGAWRATVYGVVEGRARLKQLSTHPCEIQKDPKLTPTSEVPGEEAGPQA